MIFINDAKIYAKVWHIDRQDKYTDVRISTSEKDKDGNYINSNWFARLIGHAHQKLKDIKEEDRITITQAKLSNEPYTDKEGNKKSAFRFLILEAEDANSSGDTAEKAESKSKSKKKAEAEEDGVEGGNDGDMPW